MLFRSPISRELSHDVLEHLGSSVTVAEDGQVALARAQAERFDLILMDMQMPRMDGLEATRAIRVDSLNRDTPILAMTANAFDEDRQRCLDAGMNAHLSKPLDFEALEAAMAEWCPRLLG